MIVDNSDIECFNLGNVEHSLNAFKDNYKLDIACTSELYCWIVLDWNYKDRYIDMYMQGYIKNNTNNMISFGKDHLKIDCTWHSQKSMEKCPRSHPRRCYQWIIQGQEKLLQQVVGILLLWQGCWHHPAHDSQHISCWIIHSHRIHNRTSWITSWFLYTEPKHKIQIKRYKNLIWYLTSTLMFCAPKETSWTKWFFLGWLPHNKQPMKLNLPIHLLTTLLRFVPAWASKTRRSLCQCKREKIYLSHSWRNVTPQTPNHQHQFTSMIPQPQKM